MNQQRAFLSVAYDEDEDFMSLLDTLATLPVEMRVGKRNGEPKLWVTPRSELSKDLQQRVARFKERIIQLIQDREYQRTGVIQCERQVFDIAKERLR